MILDLQCLVRLIRNRFRGLFGTSINFADSGVALIHATVQVYITAHCMFKLLCQIFGMLHDLAGNHMLLGGTTLNLNEDLAVVTFL